MKTYVFKMTVTRYVRAKSEEEARWQLETASDGSIGWELVDVKEAS